MSTRATKITLLLIRLQVRHEVRAVLLLLQSGEDHLGSRNVLLGVNEVFHELPFVPCHTRFFVGLGVRESFGLSGLAAGNTSKIRTIFVSVGLKHRFSCEENEEVKRTQFPACAYWVH